ncbi:MAG: Mrp/NBP35 family ATP-binding protein [Planctomycetota bacterium]|nr:Mrp/NBP35 family ATP-binding protein [Planctomycetota bacterium]
MALTTEQIRDALRTVQDPELHRDLVSLNMVKDVRVEGEDAFIVIELTTPACPLKDQIRADVEQAVRAWGEEHGEPVGAINIELTADVRKANERVRGEESPLPAVKHVIAVGAGKGGVGKSTVAVNLAVGLARQGAKTGLLDGDIYGPSITTMLGLESLNPQVAGDMIVPFQAHGIKAMSLGKLVEPDKALIWRGPMAHNAFRQLATQTEWGELDYLIVDLPPGTGDVPLTLTQLLPLTGAVIVCTPQRVAQDDARRAVQMFRQLGVEMLGVVENMSYFVGDDGKEYDIFGRGGAQTLAQSMGVPFLGMVPIHMELRANSDEGAPQRNWEGNETLAKELDAIVENVAAQVSLASMRGDLTQPTISVT